MGTTGRTSRRFQLLAAALLMVLGVAACSGSKSSDQAGGSTSKTVNWWGWAPGKALADTYIAAFSKAHPDVKVVYKEVPYAEYVNALRLGLQADSGPDVFALQPGEITDRFGPSAADLTSRADTDLGKDWRSTITGEAQSQFEVDGKQLGMPVQLSASGLLWYNKSLFDANHLTPPTTAAEVQQVCDAFAKKKVTCFEQGAKDSWANIDFYMTLAADTAPGAFYEAIDGKRRWTDPGLVAAFKTWKDMFDKGYFGKGAAGLAVYPDASANFAQGRSAMTLLGTWQASFMDAASLKLSREGKGTTKELPVILPLAFPDMNGDGKKPKTFGGPDYGLAINSKSSAQDAAWTFVRWLSTDKAGQQLIAANKFLPALSGVPLSSKGLVDQAAQEPALKQVLSFMADIDGYREIPYAKIKTALGDALSALSVGQQTPEQAAQAVQQASEQITRR